MKKLVMGSALRFGPHLDSCCSTLKDQGDLSEQVTVMFLFMNT